MIRKPCLKLHNEQGSLNCIKTHMSHWDMYFTIVFSDKKKQTFMVLMSGTHIGVI